MPHPGLKVATNPHFDGRIVGVFGIVVVCSLVSLEGLDWKTPTCKAQNICTVNVSSHI